MVAAPRASMVEVVSVDVSTLLTRRSPATRMESLRALWVLYSPRNLAVAGSVGLWAGHRGIVPSATCRVSLAVGILSPALLDSSHRFLWSRSVWRSSAQQSSNLDSMRETVHFQRTKPAAVNLTGLPCLYNQ